MLVFSVDAFLAVFLPHQNITFLHLPLTHPNPSSSLLLLFLSLSLFNRQILGITRQGVARMKQSILMLASFEQTVEYLFEAALRGHSDTISGVSECIIMGRPIPLGTGLFKLLQKLDEFELPHTKPLLLGNPLSAEGLR